MLAYGIYFIASVFLGALLLVLSVFNSKIRLNYYTSYKQIFYIKEVLSTKNINKKTVLLFHAASSGEYEQIKPILRNLDKQKFFIIQSFTSPSIYNQDHNNQLYDLKLYHPFDLFWLSYLFFKNINPQKYIITRHDIWPGHILTAKLLNIPIYYINANVHQNSFWYKRSIRLFSKYILNKITCFIVPSEQIYNNLLNINISPSKIQIIRDSRFDQIIHSKNKRSQQAIIPDGWNKNNTIIFGSIDRQDEKFIFDSLPIIIKNKSIILVPHEIDNNTIIRISNKLESLSCSFIKSSVLPHSMIGITVLLVDQLGLLTNLYAHANKAYIGGGFQRGVHSVLEPAIYDCSIGCGPNIEILDEAKQLYVSGNLTIINNQEDMDTFLINDSNDSNSSKVFNNSNGVSKLIEHILL